IKSLNDLTAAPYVRNSISLIFNDEKLQYIDTLSYVSKYYQAIKSLPNDVDVFRPLADRDNALAERINDKNLESLDSKFIDDVFSTDSLPPVMGKIITLSQSCFADSDSLYAAFNNLGANRKLILTKMKESDKSVSSNSVAHMFAEWYRSTDVKQLKQSENVNFLWTVLDGDQRTEILRELHDILLEGDRSIERRIAVIQDFHDVLVFNEPEKKTSRRAIAALFPRSLEDKVLREWLDAQTLKLSSWSPEDAESVSHVVCENHELFPGLSNSSPYIKKRLNQES
ncbi:hypothetical protein P9A85_004117, partial [Escherichia coli]|nr:hypothetical protein [Escherichia coli]